MGKCCQMDEPLVGKVYVKFELDPSSYEPSASHSLAFAKNLQQALKSCFDAFNAYLLCVRIGNFVGP